MLKRSLRRSFSGAAVACAMLMVCNPEEPADDLIRCSESCPAPVSALTLLCPDGSRDYQVGDKVQVKWCYPTTGIPISGVVVLLDTLDGRGAFNINLQSGESIDAPANTLTWVVGEGQVGAACRLKVEVYGDPLTSDETPQAFSITPAD